MKKSLCASALSVILINLNCYGDVNPSVNTNYPNHIYLGPEVFGFDLNTRIKSVKVEGLRYFVGAKLRYEYLKPKALYAGVDFLWSKGNKDFKSSSRDYHFHGKGGIGFGNFELRMGYTFAPKNGMISPFLGLGLYGFGNTSSNELLIYAAAGMRSLFELTRSFSLGLNLKAIFAPDAEQKFKYRHDGHTIRLKDSENIWGGEIGIPFVWYLASSKRWEIQFEPYFLQLDFSEIQNIYGARLLFGYRF